MTRLSDNLIKAAQEASAIAQGRTYTIGQLGTEFGVSHRTLRFYEEKGFLHPARSDGGTRFFTETDRKTLKAILTAKALGFTLEEIAGMVQDGEVRIDPETIDRQIAFLEERAEEPSNAIRDLVRIADAMRAAA